MLGWRENKYLNEVQDGEVIIISHNRGTWQHKDPGRNNCVVVTRQGDRFSQFGPGAFDANEIDHWARFNSPFG